MQVYEITYVRKLVKDGPAAEQIDKPEKAVDYFRENCFDPDEMWREKVFALFVDRMKMPVGHILVGVGDDTTVTISNKLIAKAALDSSADGVILCHNHPSGEPKPGHDDIRATDSLRKGLGCLDISLIDHVILGEKTYFSFQAEVERKFPRNHGAEHHF